MPCFFKHKTGYKRARIESVGDDDTFVCLVDDGLHEYVKNNMIMQLPKELAVLPPASYICALKSMQKLLY